MNTVTSKNTFLTVAGSFDPQLLAQRGLQHWLRRLSVGGPQRIHQSSVILCF